MRCNKELLTYLLTKWYSDALEARNTRDGDTGNEDDSSFAGFLNLTNVPCSVLS